MTARERQALDNHITGNGGEDQFRPEPQSEAVGEGDIYYALSHQRGSKLFQTTEAAVQFAKKEFQRYPTTKCASVVYRCTIDSSVCIGVIVYHPDTGPVIHKFAGWPNSQKERHANAIGQLADDLIADMEQMVRENREDFDEAVAVPFNFLDEEEWVDTFKDGLWDEVEKAIRSRYTGDEIGVVD